MSHSDTTRILLIDDDDIFCRLFQKNIVDNNDKNKNEAGNEPKIEIEVLNRLKELKNYQGFQETDLILLDYDLYDGTGIEASEWLEKIAPNIPQVIISTSDRDIHKKKDGAIKGFVTKWQGQQEFLEAVKKYRTA